MRARWWSPELGSFLSIDDYAFYERTGTLWSWPRQNPIAWRDPSGHRPDGPSQPYSDPQFRQGSELGFALGSAALAITLGPWWGGVLATGATVANHDEMGKFIFAVPSIAGAAGAASETVGFAEPAGAAGEALV